jgi:hypothetical protein
MCRGELLIFAHSRPVDRAPIRSPGLKLRQRGISDAVMEKTKIRSFRIVVVNERVKNGTVFPGSVTTGASAAHECW